MTTSPILDGAYAGFPAAAWRGGGECKKASCEHGLQIVCLMPPTVEYPMNLASADLAVRKKTVDYLVHAIEYANELETPIVSFDAGLVTLDGDFSAAWSRPRESLGYLAGLAGCYGVKLALEITGGRKDSLLNGSTNAARLKEELASPDIGFTMDTVFCRWQRRRPSSFLTDWTSKMYCMYTLQTANVLPCI